MSAEGPAPSAGQSCLQAADAKSNSLHSPSLQPRPMLTPKKTSPLSQDFIGDVLTTKSGHTGTSAPKQNGSAEAGLLPSNWMDSLSSDTFKPRQRSLSGGGQEKKNAADLESVVSSRPQGGFYDEASVRTGGIVEDDDELTAVTG